VDKDKQLHKITSEYLPAFLGFAINKIGNISEAEELAQEVAFQCLIAINKQKDIHNFDAYIWSIAYNTYKRWCYNSNSCSRKNTISLDSELNTFSNIASNDISIGEHIVEKEKANAIRLAVSTLASNYRKIIVCFYYEELPIREIGKRLSLTEGMIEFYLRAGKQKLKEAYIMNQIGEKSFHPSEFTVYKSAIDFSNVNVWDDFKRRLPCQIALICHDSAKTISEISIETGTPAVYIEDEIKLLLDAGVMIMPVKDKYRTNLFILKKNTAAQIRGQFTKFYDAYTTSVISTYEKYLPKLKECNIFRFDASQNQWAWYFASNISEFDYCGHGLSAEDYPQILSCGSKGFIFAEESDISPWTVGVTPTALEKCVVYPCDVVIFGEYHR
jgi:RNA polymerase sigma factor (sigma-70 family)